MSDANDDRTDVTRAVQPAGGADGRRRFLALAGLGATGVALAGCKESALEVEPAVYRAALSSGTDVFATIADLRCAPVANVGEGDAVFVLGYHAPGDGGGGVFYFDGMSSEPADEGLVIRPQSGPDCSTPEAGAWLRVWDGSAINARWFGPDATGAQDAQPALQAAIDAAQQTGATLNLPSGAYKLENTLVVDEAMRIRGSGGVTLDGGEGQPAVLSQVTGTSLLKHFDGTALELNHHVVVEGIKVDIHPQYDGPNTRDGIVLRNQATLRDVQVSRQGSLDSNSVALGSGIRIGDEGRNCNFWRLENVQVRLNGGNGVHIHDPTVNPDPNLRTSNCNAGTVSGLNCHKNAGAGLRIDNGANNSFYGLKCESNGGYGIELSSLSEMQTDYKSKGNAFFKPYLENNRTLYADGVEVRIAPGAERTVIWEWRGGPGDPEVSAIEDQGEETVLFLPKDYDGVNWPYLTGLALGALRVAGGIEGPLSLAGPVSISDNDSIAGSFTIEQNEPRKHEFIARGSGGTQTFHFTNEVSTPDMTTVEVDGSLVASKDVHVGGQLMAAIDSGNTGNRPGTPGRGQMYFDTTLGRPIWCSQQDDGTGSPLWVDASGTVV